MASHVIQPDQFDYSDHPLTQDSWIHAEDQFYETFFFDQLYQIVQRIFTHSPDQSLENYIRSILNYSTDLTPTLQLGICPFEERMKLFHECKSSDISHIFYQSGYFGTPGPKPTGFHHNYQHLCIFLSFAITTQNPELVTWILNPQHDPSKTWEQRIIDADQVIETIKLSDSNILEDFFTCARVTEMGSSSRFVIFELLLKFSPRHFEVIKTHIETTRKHNKPPRNDNDTTAQNNQSVFLRHPHSCILSAVLGQVRFLATMVQLLRLLDTNGIKLFFDLDIAPVFSYEQSEATAALESIIQSLSHLDDVKLFDFSIDLFGGYNCTFGQLGCTQGLYHILRNHSIKILDYVIDKKYIRFQDIGSGQNCSNLFGFFLDDELQCFCIESLCERGDEMMKKLLNIQVLHDAAAAAAAADDDDDDDDHTVKYPFSDLLLESTRNNTHETSFQAAYRKASGGLGVMYNHHDEIRKHHKFDHNHFAMVAQDWNRPFERLLYFLLSLPQDCSQFSTTNHYTFPRFDQHFGCFDQVSLFYDAFIPSNVTLPPLAGGGDGVGGDDESGDDESDNDGDSDNDSDSDDIDNDVGNGDNEGDNGDNDAGNGEEDSEEEAEDTYTKLLRELDEIDHISDVNDWSHLVSTSMPLLFFILSRNMGSVSRLVPLLTLFLNNKTHERISLNTMINICIQDYRSTPDCTTIKTQFQNISPISFFVITDAKRDDSLNWSDDHVETHPIEFMIDHYLNSLLIGKENGYHPRITQDIIVKIPNGHQPE